MLEFVVALPYNYLAICSIKSKRIGANCAVILKLVFKPRTITSALANVYIAVRSIQAIAVFIVRIGTHGIVSIA